MSPGLVLLSLLSSIRTLRLLLLFFFFFSCCLKTTICLSVRVSSVLDRADEHVVVPAVGKNQREQVYQIAYCGGRFVRATGESFNGSVTHKVLNVIIEIPDKKFPSDVRNLTSGALSTRYSLISNFLFSICILQVGSADLCNLWCEARSVALENARREWLQAEVTGCDNFCLADKHRQNHSSFLFSITMNSALGCQCSFMCPYSL